MLGIDYKKGNNIYDIYLEIYLQLMLFFTVTYRKPLPQTTTYKQARKRYELVLFPCERHSPHKLQDTMYIEDIMHDFLVTNLHPSVVNAHGAVYNALAGAASGVVNAPIKIPSSL